MAEAVPSFRELLAGAEVIGGNWITDPLIFDLRQLDRMTGKRPLPPVKPPAPAKPSVYPAGDFPRAAMRMSANG